MPLKKEDIERLVLEDLSGVISPEDSAALKKLIEEDPEARAIWEDIERQLNTPQVRAAREEFLSMHPVEDLFAEIKKVKQKRIYRVMSIGVAASVLALLFVNYIKQPDIKNSSPVSLHSSALKSVALQLPGTPSVDLGSRQQQIRFGSVVFHGQEDHLSWSGKDGNSQPATITVPNGRNYTATLPDGSEIKLNQESTLQFPITFNGKTREITIHGEAYLKIAHDPDKPFLVHLPHGTVHVLGTEFSVNTRDNQQVKVALATGAVKVVTTADTLTLKPMQMVSYEEGKPMQAQAIGNNDPFYWKDTYPFMDAKLHDVGIKILELYGIDVIIDGNTTGNMIITATLDHHKPLKDFLDELKKDSLDYFFEKGENILHIKSEH
jgi:ferric-dicitrate binding protein FerR (iron transport regulator)